MTRRAEFPVSVKLTAWKRAGGPDDPRCECWRLEGFDNCGRQPITKSDPAEYHHVEEAESSDTPECRKYLRSLENCLCLRQSCHRGITKTVTMPRIVKSRRQRAGEANARRKSCRPVPGSIASGWYKPVSGPGRRRDRRREG